jgi:integrase
MKLWPRAFPRTLRFHDLRHTTATLLLKAGVPLATVQRILRHSDPAITTEVYGHLDLDDMRKGLNQLASPSRAPPPGRPRRRSWPRWPPETRILRLLLVCC